MLTVAKSPKPPGARFSPRSTFLIRNSGPAGNHRPLTQPRWAERIPASPRTFTLACLRYSTPHFRTCRSAPPASKAKRLHYGALSMINYHRCAYAHTVPDRFFGGRSMERSLAVRDFGQVGPLQSQAIWHALASRAKRPMLTFMRPAGPYVSLGMHRHQDEIDLAYLEEQELPLLRRYAGGGPVYLDAQQLFFQIYLPKEMARGSRTKLIESLLTPAAGAFRSLIAEAGLDGYGEISANGRKLCGHGAAEIGQGVVVVGNLIESFDAATGSKILKLHPLARERTTKLMERFVGPSSKISADDAFITEMTAAYLKLFEVEKLGDLALGEFLSGVGEFERKLADPEFLAGTELGIKPPSQPISIKVRAGVQLLVAEEVGWLAMATTVFGRLEAMEVVKDGKELARWDAIGLLAKSDLGRAFLHRLAKFKPAA